MKYKYTPAKPKKLSSKEPFKSTGNKRFTVLDFWQYAYSNLNSNIARGVLAEFIVENALNSRIGVRDPWADWDVLGPDGVKIEVKCCAYLQAWPQDKLSRISFSGLKATKLYWSSALSGAHKAKQRPDYKSDVYVLCLVNHQVTKTLNLLDMDQWSFFVLSKNRLKQVTKNGSSVSLSTLEKHGVEPVAFAGLRRAVLQAKKEQDAPK